MIVISSIAQDKIREMKEEMDEDIILKYGVKSACCNELNYALSLSKKNKDDRIFEFPGFKVAVHPADIRYITDTKIEYSEEGDGGFYISSRHPLVSQLI
ncbi:HesB/IscA family protein [Peribacillus sp. B-H-3]|uniref:HesB/IscA family protein n=1 Tax=Peribacillus sp. B-H-3 TaxID=3400420 RepID=UPI003B020E4E